MGDQMRINNMNQSLPFRSAHAAQQTPQVQEDIEQISVIDLLILLALRRLPVQALRKQTRY